MNLEQCDLLLGDLIRAEAAEQAALLMLGHVDSVEMAAAYELAVERVEDARERYRDAVGSQHSVEVG
jgi:hypothetical protein